MQVFACLPFASVQFAHHAPGGVLFYTFGAGSAAQHILALILQSDFADLKARDQQQLVRGLNPLKVIIADRADISDNMGVFLLHGIAA